MSKCIFILPLIIFIFGCSGQNGTCEESWKILKNPRLDVIADDLSNIRAKIASGAGTQEDYEKMSQLQSEEDAIWKSAENACR